MVPIVPKDVGDKMLRMQGAYAQFCATIDRCAAQFKAEANGSRKAYAEKVLASGHWAPPFFQLWEGKVDSTRAWIRGNYDRKKLPDSSLDTILSHLATQ